MSARVYHVTHITFFICSFSFLVGCTAARQFAPPPYTPDQKRCLVEQEIRADIELAKCGVTACSRDQIDAIEREHHNGNDKCLAKR